jgi:hypothetical protein
MATSNELLPAEDQHSELRAIAQSRSLPAGYVFLAKLILEFLEQNPPVRFHFTPTYSSWLNQIEIWFAKIERDVIARGIFTSVSDLARSFAATTTPIQPTHGLSDGNTPTLPAASVLTNSLRQATSQLIVVSIIPVYAQAE